MFDRSSGELRLSTIARLLATENEVYIHVFGAKSQIERYGTAEIERYKRHLCEVNVYPHEGNLTELLRREVFDSVILEFFGAAQRFLDDIRVWQPQAYVIVDTVDVHFRRLKSKAEITGEKADIIEAENTKKAELDIYRKADLLITVTEEDKNALLVENARLRIAVIPNIHEIPEATPRKERQPESFLFVGNFIHKPNGDAIEYFCLRILPLLIKQLTNIVVNVVGDKPTNIVRALASDRVRIHGYIPDLTSHLRTNYVSIAPLRFGAGMKGKIGEAMSYGMPVVTTSVGIDGFGLTPGENVLIGDSPNEFAQQILDLSHNPFLYEKLARNGRAFIRTHYSNEAVVERIQKIFSGLQSSPMKGNRIIRFKKKSSYFFRRNILWRIRKYQ